VQSANVVNNGRSIAAAIIRGLARAVSDGSFKNAMGTSASILFYSKATNPNRIISFNSVPGKREEQSAYRSELAGVSGSLSLIAAVCTVHDIHTGSITIGLDGEQAMISAWEDWPLSPAQPDYDLLTDIRAKVRGLPIKVHWKWIKGHEDDGPSHDSLDEWAQANIYMDSLAKAHWNYLNETGHCPSQSGSKMKTGRSPSKIKNSAVWTKSHFMMPLWNLLPKLTGRSEATFLRAISLLLIGN
jgi:hypothetical protein